MSAKSTVLDLLLTYDEQFLGYRNLFVLMNSLRNHESTCPSVSD